MRKPAMTVSIMMSRSPHFPATLRKPAIKTTDEIRNAINNANTKYGIYCIPRISGL